MTTIVKMMLYLASKIQNNTKSMGCEFFQLYQLF